MKHLVIVLTSWLLCLPGLCQEKSPATLTFKEAVKIALKNNVLLQQTKNQRFANQADKMASIASLAPDVSAFTQARNGKGNQFIQQELRLVSIETNSVFGSVDVDMMLFNGFNRLNNVKRANARLDAQQYLVQRTEQDVINNVSIQFLQCLLDQELVKIAEKNLESQQQQLDQIQAQVAAGSRAQVDEYNQLSQAKNAELELLRANIDLRNDLATLANTLLVDPVEQFELKEPAWDVNKISLESYPLEELYESANKSRGDYLQAQMTEVAIKRELAMSKSAFIPRLSAFYNQNTFYTDASETSFSNQLDNNRERRYGLSLSLPIFSGLRNRATYVQSKVNYENAQLDTKNTEMNVRTDVIRAYQNFRDVITAYQVASAQLEAAELSFNLEKERYDLGLTDLVQFTQANRDFVQAQTDFAQAKYRLLFQEIALKYTLGTLKFEDIP